MSFHQSILLTTFASQHTLRWRAAGGPSLLDWTFQRFPPRRQYVGSQRSTASAPLFLTDVLFSPPGLRNAFSRCPGFKRLQFRSKSNGPIVFVEFVDTAHATRAMQELYGHTLGGLVKGGIRLSYSRNPLGVRSNGPPQGGSLLPGHGASAMVGLDGPSASSYASSPFGPASSSAVPCHPQFDPFDSHRRPPDPIYGENPARSPPAMSPLAQPSSLSSYRFGAPGQVSPPATSASLYGGNFSPFGFDP